MKISAFTLSILGLLSTGLFANASSNFVPYPIRCAQIVDQQPLDIQALIEERGGVIEGTLIDNGDRARLACEEIANEINGSVLHCEGHWESDGSLARFSTPLFTFVAMPTIQRSAAAFGGETINGICVD